MPVELHDVRGLSDKLTPRLERKFYLSPDKVEMAYGLLRTLCRPDGEYPVEWINSLYFDSPDLEQYECSLSGDYRKDKVRIRWYGSDGANGPATVFLELKSRYGFASTKQRQVMRAPAGSLAQLSCGIVPEARLLDTLAGFDFFPTKALKPIIKISYLRFRFREILTGQSIALDCHIHARAVAPQLRTDEPPLELTGAVLEIKGKDMELPPTLKGLKLLDIDWSRFSKYSACVGACGERLGQHGRVSPSGMSVAEAPVMLRESCHWGNGWERLFMSDEVCKQSGATPLPENKKEVS